MLMNFLLLFTGFVLLYFGAEGLVRGSSSLASRLGMSALVIGLTIVAYGTSMPEMVVSVKTSLNGQGSIAIGNVVGSNIFNIAVILGITALIHPLKVKLQIIKYDTPIMIGTTIIFLFFFADSFISRLEGAIFFTGIVIYTAVNLIMAKKDPSQIGETDTGNAKLNSLAAEISFIAGGMLLLVLGSKWLVDGAIGVAQHFGISEAIIGLTIIAAGTSLPELATSVIAAIRKEPDIAIANIIGSNIFNILSIVGTSALISPIDGTGISVIDSLVMLAVSLMLLPLLRSGYNLGRIEGFCLLAGYIAYLAYLILYI
ncbi:calcium/sodium antiporter [Candidatus Sumerlaeota bacterium]|nr:calcium/sodium antiporter [Candidatus Sumerlaeota bacterium]